MTLPERFPRLAEYIDALAEGLASYPECQSKGSLLRSALEGTDPKEMLPGLPDELVDYVHSPPPNGAWIPAVHSTALFYAVCDRYYQTEPEMADWVRKRTQVLGTSLYRGVLRIAGPRVLFRMLGGIQGLMQRGTKLEVVDVQSHQLVLRLTFPANLHTHFMLLANPPTFEELGKLFGGKELACRLVRYSKTSATYEVRWQ